MSGAYGDMSGRDWDMNAPRTSRAPRNGAGQSHLGPV